MLPYNTLPLTLSFIMTGVHVKYINYFRDVLASHLATVT